MPVDTGQLGLFQRIVEKEVGGVLRAVSEVSEDVKTVDGRLRLLELSNTKVITELGAKLGTLEARLNKYEADLNVLGNRQQDWGKHYKIMEQQIIENVQELYVSKDDFEAFKLAELKEQSTKWTTQTEINTSNKNLRAALWVLAGMALSGLFALLWQLFIHGGIQGLANYLNP